MAGVSSSLGEAARLNVPVRLSGFVIGAAMPFALYFSTKSATLFAGLAAALALWGLWREGCWPDVAAGLRGVGRDPAFWLASALSGYAVAGVFWGAFAGNAATTALEIAVALAVPAALALCYRVLLPYRFGFGIACGLIAAAAFALFEFRYGLKLRGMLGIRSYPFVFNRGIVYLVMLIWPMFLLVERKDRWLAVIAALMVALAAAVSESGAAVLGLACGTLALALAGLASRLALKLVGAGALAYLAVAPWLGEWLGRLTTMTSIARLEGAHAGERIGIWTAFGAYLRQNPLFGTGLGSSANALEHPAAQAVPEAIRPMLANNHPHNAFLQIWVELGLTGAVLAGALLATILMRVEVLNRRQRIHAAAFSACALAISAVSHGAWQAWWLTTFGVIAAIFWATRERDDVHVRG